MKKLSNTTIGIICIITSAFFFALMAVFVRLAGDIFFMQKAFFRNIVAFLIALIGILSDAKLHGKQALLIPKGAVIFLLLRSFIGSIGVFGNFYAIDRLVLSDASILNKMAPFFAIVFSIVLMKEKIRPIPLIAIITAFLGSMLIVKPSFDFSKTLPSFVGFLGGMGAGFAYACVRKLSYLKCPAKIVVLIFSLTSSLLCVPYMITNFNPMTVSQTIFLCCAGICAAAAQFSITAAYFHAPAREISIYDYSQIIFSTIMGLVFFGQLPDVLSFTGYLIIISMAALNFIYNKKIHEKQHSTMN